MLNKKVIIISSAVVAAVAIVTAVGISVSKADSLKDKKDKPSVEAKSDKDTDDDLTNGIVDLNADALDHGSVILQDGSSSKDIVIKDDSKKESIKDTESNKDSKKDNGDKSSKNFDADSDDDKDNGIVTPNSDASDHGSVVLQDGSSSKDIVVDKQSKDESKDFDADSDDDVANGIVTPNSDASDHGSVVLSGGASSKDIVR